MSQEASAVRATVASVPTLTGKAADEWRLLKADLLSASWLGDYYANRIKGLTYLDYALKTGRESEYQTALKYLADSRQAWKQLGETADAIYRPLSNPLRKQADFQWSDQLDSIEKLDATAPQLWTDHVSKADVAPLTFTAADVGKDAGLRVEKLEHTISNTKDTATISCRASAKKGIKKLTLWFKPLPSELPWQSMDMTKLANGSFSATTVLTHEGLMYLVKVQDKTGQAKNFPPVLEETPYRVIPAFVAKTSRE